MDIKNMIHKINQLSDEERNLIKYMLKEAYKADKYKGVKNRV